MMKDRKSKRNKANTPLCITISQKHLEKLAKLKTKAQLGTVHEG
jgi:hypothetical protein